MLTHCGVEGARINGRWWHADKPLYGRDGAGSWTILSHSRQDFFGLVLAKLAARSGDAAIALETIAEAVARVDRTDFLFDRGTVHTDRGETLRLLGREDEALSAFDEAIGLFDRKGDLVSSVRVRRLRTEAMR